MTPAGAAQGMRLVAACAALPLLSGCVAAVAAIPLMTGTAVATREIGHRKVSRPSSPPPPVPAPPVPAPQTAAEATSQPIARLVGLRELPPPTANDNADGYTALATFALAQQKASGDQRVSAIKAPGSSPLSPAPLPCPSGPAFVVIDLDPAGKAFDPATAGTPQPGLVAALATLRANGIVPLWASRLPAGSADAVHAALARTGLDATGKDELILSGPGRDAMESARTAVARNHCVVALAGDRRGDFDLLYDYLRDPDAVVPTDRLIGNGWFLAPPPLN